MPEISRLDEDVLASQEALCCMELVSQAIGWLVSGTRLPWRHSFSEYAPHKLEKFIEGGVWYNAPKLPAGNFFCALYHKL